MRFVRAVLARVGLVKDARVFVSVSVRRAGVDHLVLRREVRVNDGDRLQLVVPMKEA